MQIIFHNGWLSIIDLLNVERTCEYFKWNIRQSCSLHEVTNGETFQQFTILESMAASIHTNDDFIRVLIHDKLQDQASFFEW